MAADRNRFSTYGYPLRFELPGSDIQKTGFLKKLKTMKKKFFVLRSTSSSGPARFEYFDSEKKFTANQLPKRSIPLHQCFNINKKTDTRHKYAVVLFTKEDSFSFITENEVEQETWLNLLLEYQNEYLLMTKEQPRPHFEIVWQGLIKQKSNKCLNLSGHYRLCLSSKEVSLARVNWDKIEYTFQFASIRKCGNSENYFFMEVGRQASTGEGEIWMQVEDSNVAQKIHETILTAMTTARSQENLNPRMRARSQTTTARPPLDTSASAIRARAVSESHSSGWWQVPSQLPSDQRPQSQIFTQSRTSLSPTEPAFPIGSPQSLLPSDALSADLRGRSDSVGSRSSGGSRSAIEQSDLTNHGVVSYRSTTPDTSIAICEEIPENSDYLDMTPNHHSTTPSPTPDRLERPGSSGSGESQGEIGPRLNDGYVDMKPNSPLSSFGNESSYTDMSPGSLKVPNSDSGYLMMGSVTPSGSNPGRTIPSIPIWPSKEQGYLDMGPPCQHLPTVKEGGSGEAYLPMTPTSQSPVLNDFPRPAKVISYLSDDSMSGEFPKRAYSVGSRPNQNHGVHRQYQNHEMIRKQAVSDNNRSSSAPHLIGQRPRTVHGDSRSPYINSSAGSSSPLSQSIKSDDVEGFMEMDFYRPRTASDSYGCRGRSPSFGKASVQGHRPRSSSYGQTSRGKLGSYESVRTTSQELILKKISHDSLAQLSVSSLASSNESMRKLSEESHCSSVQSDYVDMACNKGKTPSPVTQATAKDGYVDMTVGSRSGPPSVSRSSSSQSLGSSPASLGRTKREAVLSEAVIIKASGQVKQCPEFIGTPPSGSGGSYMQKNQLQVIGAQSKKSPSSSGRESEDESYVPYQPGIKCGSLPTPQGEYLESQSHRDRSSSSGKKSDRSGAGSHDHSFSHGDRSPSSRKVDISKGLVQSVEQSRSHSLEKSSTKFDSEFSVKSKGHPQQRSSQESRGSKFSKSQHVEEGKYSSSEKHPKEKQISKTKVSSGKKTPPLPKSKDDSVYIGYEPDKSKALMQQSFGGLEHSSGKSGKTQHWEVESHPSSCQSMPSKSYADSKSVLSDGKNILSREAREENKKSKFMSTTFSVQHSAAPPSEYEIYDPLGSHIFASESKYRTPEQQGSVARSSKPEQKVASASIDNICSSDVTQLKESKNYSSKKKRGDMEAEIFSYVDYCPKEETTVDSENWEIKTPSRVSSFISEHSEDISNTDLSKNTSQGISGTDESNTNVVKSVSTNIGKSMSQSDCKKGSGNCSPVQDVRNAKKPVSGQVNKGGESDIPVNKLVEIEVKNQGQSLKIDIQDDGYIDLDFHTQKGSSKDKGLTEPVAQFSIGEQGAECAELIQNPKCYILDENDTTGSTERSPTDKSSPTKRLVTLNSSGVDRLQGNSSKELVQKVITLRQVQPQDSPVMGLTSSSVPKQATVPPKLSTLQKSNPESPRLRNTSGPASYRSGGNASNGEQTKKVVGPLSSNPSQNVSELHQPGASMGKQNSMPCMATQVESELPDESELQAIDSARSRHSLSDLSSYEEMDFSAERKMFGSQQQLQGSEPKQVTLNYASLDLGSSENVDENGQRKNRHSSCLEDSEPKEKVSYAEIDFQKSENLKNSTNKSAKFTL